MADIEKLRAELLQLSTEESTLDKEIALKERELRTTAERKEKVAHLQSEAVELQKKTVEPREYVAKAKHDLAEFPTETQVVKLERRLESLKDQLKESEKQIQQHRTGIEAYTVRRADNSEAMQKLVSTTAQQVQEMAKLAEAKQEMDKLVKSATVVSDGIKDLDANCDVREKELQQHIKLIEVLAEEERAITLRIAELQNRAQRQIPELDAEKDKDIDEITTEWNKEKTLLQAVYDKLYVINREQQFHLQRGTHVRRQIVSAPPLMEETALSSQHARLAEGLNAAKAKSAELRSEVNLNQRQLDQFRADARAAHEKFEKTKQEVEVRLRQAKAEHQQIEEEATRLRLLKAELQDVLHAIRDGTVLAPKISSTPRRALPSPY